MTNPENTSTDVITDELALKIAKSTVPLLETLEPRHRDALDFHDVSVFTIRNLIRRAYAEGYAAGASNVVQNA